MMEQPAKPDHHQLLQVQQVRLDQLVPLDLKVKPAQQVGREHRE
jgi:hypothetical protein